VRATTALVLVAGLLMAVGCSDDDARGGSTTVVTEPPTTTETTAVATTSAPATTATPTTSDPPTTTASPVTTTTPPTTAPVDEEALKAQIADDYERAFYRSYEMLGNPRLRNLNTRAARVAAAGSPAFHDFVEIIEELVALGDRWVPNEPDLLSADVEKVELVGEQPYRRAIVTVCEVTNRKQVTPPENSPTGEEILVAGTGQLLVLRLVEPVRLTPNGWLRYRAGGRGTQFDQGETTCPPE
jgi:hypothetical protein